MDKERAKTMMLQLVNLSDIEMCFMGTNFGSLDGKDLFNKLLYALKNLEDRLYDYHTGWTMTQILIELKWLTPQTKKVTGNGICILRAYRYFKRDIHDSEKGGCTIIIYH